MTVPTKLQAGDTLSFYFASNDYQPPLWVSTFTIRNALDVYTVTGTNNGDGTFKINQPATAGWFPGQYTAYLSVTNGTDRHVIYQGPLSIGHDPLAGVADDRSHIKRTLDILESVIEGRAAQDTVSYSIGGRSISKMAPSELITLHDRYLAMYRQELKDTKAANGMPFSNKIKVRFR